jgi:hypothetical protein
VKNYRRKPHALKVAWNPARKLYEPVLLEEHVLKEIVTRLWLQAKIRVVRINCAVGGKVRPNEPGIPDLVGYIPKIIHYGPISITRDIAFPLYIEVKRPGGARRPAQIRFIEEAKLAGCVAFFAESWFDVIRELYPYGVRLAA